MRGALERWFRSLFERETALYRDVVASVGAQVGQFRTLSELIAFLEAQIAAALPLRQVKITLDSSVKGNNGRLTSEAPDEEFDAVLPLQRENRSLGKLLIKAPGALTSDVRAVLDVLAGQIAIAIDDWRLVEENVRLERKVAEGERLAALGQMAATVAHEVKNPLSAIKSIAQVMSEDEALKDQHARDLTLIVGETDRLNTTVSQLLSFARAQTPAAAPATADEIVHGVVNLFRADAEERKIELSALASVATPLDGIQTAAVRDALSNLVLNALQATPRGGSVNVQATATVDEVVFAITDSGGGIPEEMREKIWQPFFTTRQRGTGLGLAIVRKRMQEAGGSAQLIASRNGEGARFELRVPCRKPDRDF